MQEQILTYASLRIASFPPFVVGEPTFCYSYKARMVKGVLFTELFESVNKIFRSIGINHNERFLAHKRDFSSMLGGKFTPKRVLIAHTCGTQLRPSFGSYRVTRMGVRYALFPRSDLCTGLIGEDCTQTRGSVPVNVKPIAPKRMKLVEPVLFTLDQECWKNQLYHIEDKGFFPILVPRIQQFGIAVDTTAQFFKVEVSTLTQVQSASDVDFLGSDTCDAVNARSIGDTRGIIHDTKPPFRLVDLVSSCAARGARLTPFSPAKARRHASTIPFFRRCKKAEELTREVA